MRFENRWSKTWPVALVTMLFLHDVVHAQVRRSQLSKAEREVYDRLSAELENGDKDPGADWNQKKPNQGLVPAVSQRVGDWPWGELLYGKRYPTHLVVKNRCETAETVSIFSRNLPYLAFPKKVRVPAASERKVPATITMPPEPPPPFVPPGGTPPAWGWVPPPFVPPGSAPFHQPNFADIGAEKGEVILWHPMTNKCSPERTSYHVSGHIHFNPPAPPDSGLQKMATPDPCEVYWLTGEPPAQLGDEDCIEKIRELASRWRDRIVKPYVDGTPEEWSWLPGVDQIQQMSVEELLEMKRRADALMRPE